MNEEDIQRIKRDGERLALRQALSAAIHKAKNKLEAAGENDFCYFEVRVTDAQAAIDDAVALKKSIVKLETEHDKAPALSAQAKAEGKGAARKLMQSLRPNNKA